MPQFTNELNQLKKTKGFQEMLKNYRLEADHYWDKTVFSDEAKYESAKRAFMQAYYAEIKPLYDMVYKQDRNGKLTTSYAHDELLQNEGLLDLLRDFRAMEADKEIRNADGERKRELQAERMRELAMDMAAGQDAHGNTKAYARETADSVRIRRDRIPGLGGHEVPADPLETSEITNTQRLRLREVHKWMIRNCARTGMGSFFGSAGSVRQYINEFMQKPAKDQLKVLEMLEAREYKSDDAAQRPLGNNYVPRLDNVKAALTANKWKFWKRKDGSYLYWHKLATAMNKVEAAKGPIGRAQEVAAASGTDKLTSIQAANMIQKDTGNILDAIKANQDGKPVWKPDGLKKTDDIFKTNTSGLEVKDHVFAGLTAINAIRNPIKAVQAIGDTAKVIKSDANKLDATASVLGTTGSVVTAGNSILTAARYVDRLTNSYEAGGKVIEGSEWLGKAGGYGGTAAGIAMNALDTGAKGVQWLSEAKKGKSIHKASELAGKMSLKAKPVTNEMTDAEKREEARKQTEAQKLSESADMAKNFNDFNQKAAKVRFCVAATNTAIYTVGLVSPIPGSMAIATGVAQTASMAADQYLSKGASNKQNQMIRKWGISDEEMDRAVENHRNMLERRLDEYPENSPKRRMIQQQLDDLDAGHTDAVKEQVRLQKARTGGFLRKKNLAEHYAEKEADQIMRNAHLKNASGEITADNIITKAEHAALKEKKKNAREQMNFEELRQEGYKDLEKGYGHKALYHKGKETTKNGRVIKTREQDRVEKYNKDKANLTAAVKKTMNK